MINKEYQFIKRMIKDSDLNGVRYFNRMVKLIKESGLNQTQKYKLNKLLESVSGYTL